NYDPAVELAAHKMGSINFVDGFTIPDYTGVTRWDPSTLEDVVSQAGRLTVVYMKMHGSVLWGLRRDGAIIKLPVGVGINPGTIQHHLIYPVAVDKPLLTEPFHTAYR